MKKNGFTLIELLAVLIVLGIIGSIAGLKVRDYLKNYKFNLCKNEINDIKDATIAWAGDNMLSLPTKESDKSINVNDINDGSYDSTDEFGVLTLTLDYLQKNGYVASDIINPISDKKFDSSLEISIAYKNNKYEYTVDSSVCEVVEE